MVHVGVKCERVRASMRGVWVWMRVVTISLLSDIK